MTEFTRIILSEIDKELAGVSYDDNDRNNLSAALFDIAIDHAKSIVVLLEDKIAIYSSAYALTRPMFESFVRAAWLQNCATVNEIQKIIKKDKFPLNFGEMLAKIEMIRDWPKTLSIIKETAISNMHSYTHGGMQIIARRFSGSDLVHIQQQEEIDELCKFATMISFLSFNEILLIGKSSKKDEIINKLFDNIRHEYST